MIKLHGVSFEYPGGVKALDDVSMTFPLKTVSAVMGESGSGKTTLLKCIGQFLHPTSGTITYENRDIYSIPEREYRRTVGIVFQDLNLFPHMNVLENITLALRKVMGEPVGHAEQLAVGLLERLRIQELCEQYPSQISGGQAQRVAIARALALRPAYMLLDEPTSALDAGTTEAFGEWLIELKEETNFIVVTHDQPFASQVAEFKVELEDGRCR